MPTPTIGDVHVNRPLTSISVAFIQEQSNFVAGDVFPVVPVMKQADAYFLYDNAYWNRDEMELRAPGAESSGNGYEIDGTPTYYCPVYAFHRDIPDQIMHNADQPINLDQEATRYVTLKALIKREKLFSTNYMAGSIWTWDYDGVSSSPTTNQVLQWNDASSTPIENVWDAKASILEKTGFEPNTLVLGYPVYKTLINHPDFIDRVKYGQTSGVAMIDVSELAAIFKVDRVLVMRGTENTAKEKATKSHSFIGGKKAMLVYSAPNPGILTPSAGYCFSWTGHVGAGADGQRIKRFYMDERAATRVEIEIAYDMKKIAADLGAFWDTVVA